MLPLDDLETLEEAVIDFSDSSSDVDYTEYSENTDPIISRFDWSEDGTFEEVYNNDYDDMETG